MIRINKDTSKWILIASLNLVVIGCIQFLKPPSTENKAINDHLNDIQTQLANLKKSINIEKIDLRPITQDINKMSEMVEQLKSKDETQFHQQLQQHNLAVTNKIDVIQQLINSLDQKQHPIKRLSAKALPFTILSIDSIQQVPVLTVKYAYKSVPLEKNDALAGWTVLQIDYSKQLAEFENSHKERVIVSLRNHHA